MIKNFTSIYKVLCNTKMLVVLFLGFASGLPLSLTASTINAWLSDEKISKTDIGLFIFVATPYALKFLWAPIVENLKLGFLTKNLGNRRAWILLSQIILIITIFTLSQSDISNVFYVAMLCLAIAFLSATQDICIDAYRVELLDDNEQGLGSATAVFGYRVGALVSGAGALFIAHYYSWQSAYASMAAIMFIGVITVIFAPKITTLFEQENSQDDIIKRSVIEPFRVFIQNTNWQLVLLFIALYKLADVFTSNMGTPFLLELGFSKVELASIGKTFGFIATIFGSFIGGILVYRFNIHKMLLLCLTLQAISNSMYLLQFQVGKVLSVLICTVAVENILSAMGTTVFVAYISRLCNKRYTATQYALLTSLASVAKLFLGSSSGYVVDHLGWQLFFVVSMFLSIPAILVLMAIIKPKFKRI